ncbi:hypothetical protein [Micromonospora zingiberis]|uniref:hypothetical protein n=1 Tax=Micromonospora zingiberis TaxID=2053011 RepID=UPI0013F476F8|nr:hypothetical protein [Micromonospora zingiberis]
MPTVHMVRGQVPVDSPARALAGRTVTTPARSLKQLAVRIREMRAAHATPVLAVKEI